MSAGRRLPLGTPPGCSRQGHLGSVGQQGLEGPLHAPSTGHVGQEQAGELAVGVLILVHPSYLPAPHRVTEVEMLVQHI